jgi:hypothetical protein
MPITVAIEPAVLTDGEVGLFALRRLTLGSGQRRSYQRAMHRPLVFRGGRLGFCGRRLLRCCRCDRRIGDARERFSGRVDDLVERRRPRRGRRRHERGAVGRCGHRSGDERGRRPRLLLSRRGSLGLLVFVFRIARGAARLLHLVLDHSDHRMVGDAALARTVVVKNVTEPNPALLHELPRSINSWRALT